jgi:hypothetical protein
MRRRNISYKLAEKAAERLVETRSPLTLEDIRNLISLSRSVVFWIL